MGERDVAGSRLPFLSRTTVALATVAASWVLAVVAASCAPRDGSRDVEVSVRDSAGITIVESPGDDRPFGAVAVRVVDLVPPDAALLAVPWGVAADAKAGRIYVAEPLGERVVVFDRSGEHIGSFGRAGDGPGEFRRPSALALDPHGVPTVWDAGRGVLSRWSSEGDLLNERRPGVSYWGPGFALAPGALFTVTSTTTSSGMLMEQRLVAVTSRGTETLHAVPRELALMELPCATMPAPKVFAPDVIWTIRGDTVYALNGPGYRIDAYVEGAPVASFRRAVPAIPVTEAMAVEGVRSGPGPYRSFMRRCDVTAERIADAVGHEEVVSPVRGIAVDPRGRLWVTRTADGIGPTFIDILDADGEYVGTLEAPGVPVAFLSDSTFVSLRLDFEVTGGTGLSLHELRDKDAGTSAPRAPTSGGPRPAREGRLGPVEFRDCPSCPVMVELPRGGS